MARQLWSGVYAGRGGLALRVRSRLLFPLLTGLLPLQSASEAVAQSIVLDGTLGPQGNLTGPIFEIQQELGTTVEDNLFHSFERFNLEAGEVANFQSDLTIRNIFSRVTGGDRSSIEGEIATTSPAVNLFLINPNGILFGPNARLNVGSSTRGSFVATTVDGLVWPDGSRFDAVTPVDSQGLLNLVGDPSGFVASQRTIPGLEINGSQLTVAPGQSLLGVGGEITLDGASLRVEQPTGGQITLASVAGAGTLPLMVSGNVLSLQVPDSLGQGDIRLTDSVIEVAAETGGNLLLLGQDVELSEGSQLRSGIAANLSLPGAQAGELRIEAQGGLRVTGESRVANEVLGTGNAGEVVIFARTVEVNEGSQLSSRTFGQGDAGNVRVTASDRILLQGTGPERLRTSGIFSSVELGSVGNAGNLVVETPVLEVLDGALLAADSIGQGNAGDVEIFARERVLFQGTTPNLEFASGVVSDVGFFGSITDGDLFGGTFSGMGFEPADLVGNGGNILIETPVLEVLDGGVLSTGIFFGTGNAGTVTVRGGERVLVQGSSPLGFPSAIFTSVESGSIGNSGSLVIETPRLEVADNAQLFARNAGQGNAGNIQIFARDQVLFQGTSPNGGVGGATAAAEGEIGDGGSIFIETALLEVLDGTFLGASTFGEGNPGNIQIFADGVRLRGSRPDGLLPGGIFSSGIFGGTGDGGNIAVETAFLEILEGAAISVNVFGDGDAGSVQIFASDRVLLDGAGSGGISSALFANNGLPNSDLQGTGTGGDIFVASPQLTLSNGAVISAQTINGESGGTITLNLDQLEVLSGGQIFTVGSGSGPAGSISILAHEQIRISGRDPLFAQRLAEFGSNVDPTSELSALTVRASGTGLAGDIVLNTANLILEDSGQILAEASSGMGGSIFIGTDPNGGPAIAPDITLLRNNGLISATAGNNQNPGDGGNINIVTPFLIGFPGENSDLIANAFTGSGGQINITSNNIFNFELTDNPIAEQLRQNTTNDISASSQFGSSGTISIETIDVDPTDGLADPPIELVDGSQLIAQNLCRDGKGSELIVTGRGGLPATPRDTFQPEAEWEDWRFSEQLTAFQPDPTVPAQTRSPQTPGVQHQSPQTTQTFLPKQPRSHPKPGFQSVQQSQATRQSHSIQHQNIHRPLNPLLEAQGWQRSLNGSIQLIAQMSSIHRGSRLQCQDL